MIKLIDSMVKQVCAYSQRVLSLIKNNFRKFKIAKNYGKLMNK
jgi:hypothetical protein